MSEANEQQQRLPFFISVEHACSYLPDQQARNLFLDPKREIDNTTWGLLLAHGFRRSGSYIYRPHCDHCRQCIAMRLPVARYQPNRSQRRNWRTNQDLQHIQRPAVFDDEHFELYSRYLHTRHRNSPMDNPQPEQYIDFLVDGGLNTYFHELRLDNKLVAVIVTDHVSHALSAVYTFFEPGLAQRGLGTFAIQWQIEHARQQGLEWLYLGYWIQDCRVMQYKANFSPAQLYRAGHWIKAED